ncbi:MAG: pilin [Patescibacteria group bacterium]
MRFAHQRITLLLAAGFFLFAASARAQIIRFPGGGGQVTTFIEQLYQFGLGVAGILAVAMIVVGGIYYSLSGAVDKRSEGKDMILSALLGVVLLLGSYVLLNTINPRLVNLALPAPSGTTSTLALTDEEFCTPENSPGGGNPPRACNTDQNEPPVRGTATCTCYIPPRRLACNPAAFTGCSPRKVIGAQIPTVNKVTDCDRIVGRFTDIGCIDDFIWDDDPPQLERVGPTSSYWQYPYYPKNKGANNALCIIYAWRDTFSSDRPRSVQRTDIDGLLPC